MTRREVARGPVPDSTFFYAVDLRVRLTVGKTFFDTLSPYAAVAAFGGPVFWNYRGSVTLGTDRNHYAIALGAVVSLPRGLDTFAEVAPLGERGVTIGGGKSF